MKKIIASLVLTLIVLLVKSAMAQNILIPEIKVGELKVKLYGFSQVVYDDETKDWDLNNLRLRTKARYGKLGFFSEINFAHCTRKDINWLRQAFFIYNFAENWEVRMGRLFLSAGNATPTPFKLETVEYPSCDFFENYAWGIQTVGKWGNGWNLSADLTGASLKTFESSENWDHVEASARLEKQLKVFLLAATTQISEDFKRISTDVTWKPQNNYYLRSAVYREISEVKGCEDKLGAYSLSVWRPFRYLEIHNQIDYRKNTSGKDDGKSVVATNGLRLFYGKQDMFSVTCDWETALDGRKDDRFLFRLQMLF